MCVLTGKARLAPTQIQNIRVYCRDKASLVRFVLKKDCVCGKIWCFVPEK